MAVEDKYIDADLIAGRLQDVTTSGGGDINYIAKSFAVASGDDNNSVYRVCRIRSNDVLTSVVRTNDAITGGTNYDIGIYTKGVGGAVVDRDLFADGLDLSSAGTNVESFSTKDAATVGQKVWELLGLSSDPSLEYDLAVTGVTVGTGNGDIGLEIFIVKQG